MPNLEGLTLRGHYRIEELLGRGGMAEVYKAWDLRRQHYVAIKVMRADLADDLEFLRRFKREARALSALSHENIVRFHSFERDEHLAFIVMDYVEGTTLQRRIREADGRSLPLGEVLLITKQVCAALQYAHSENVLHRDVKPGNIMLQSDGRVLVADFGIAKAADSATVTTVMPGTPAYMSPEQCRSQPLDARADVYSLGILVYEMLAGRRPFIGDTEATTGSTREKTRWEQLHADPPPLPRFNRAVPPQVEMALRIALAKEPDARWPTVQDFWDMLVQGAGVPERDWVAAPVHLHSEPPLVWDNWEVLAEGADVRERGRVVVPSPSVHEAAYKPSGRIRIPPWAWALAGVALVALILIVSAALSGGGRPTPEPTLVVETAVLDREITVVPPGRTVVSAITSTPRDEFPVMAETPVESLTIYYSLVDAGRYGEAWARLTRNFQVNRHKDGYASYLDYYTGLGLCEVWVEGVRLTSQEGSRATVFAVLVYDFCGGDVRRHNFDFHMVYDTDRGLWQIDSTERS